MKSVMAAVLVAFTLMYFGADPDLSSLLQAFLYSAVPYALVPAWAYFGTVTILELRLG